MILLHLNHVVYYLPDDILKNRSNLELFFRENLAQYYQCIQIKSLECYAFECFITCSSQCLRHMLIVPALVNICQL